MERNPLQNAVTVTTVADGADRLRAEKKAALKAAVEKLNQKGVDTKEAAKAQADLDRLFEENAKLNQEIGRSEAEAEFYRNR